MIPIVVSKLSYNLGIQYILNDFALDIFTRTKQLSDKQQAFVKCHKYTRKRWPFIIPYD